MEKLIIIMLLIVLGACNTKYHYVDTGISNGIHDCSMLEYLRGDSYNWDTIVRVIERADLSLLFDKDDVDNQITFLGPTNHSIRYWMQDSGYRSVNEIPKEMCEKMVLRHIIKGRYMMEDIPQGSIGTSASSEKAGGVELTTLGGGVLWFYTVASSAYGVEDAGPLTLNCLSLDFLKRVPLACPDIQTNTGIVISLDYNFYCGNL